MEIIASTSLSKSHEYVRPSSSFDCDASTFEGILGTRSLGEKNLRFDARIPTSDSTRESIRQTPNTESEIETREEEALWQDRIVQLMKHQQLIYEAEMETRRNAESLLTLIDLQQQIAITTRSQLP